MDLLAVASSVDSLLQVIRAFRTLLLQLGIPYDHPGLWTQTYDAVYALDVISVPLKWLTRLCPEEARTRPYAQVHRGQLREITDLSRSCSKIAFDIVQLTVALRPADQRTAVEEIDLYIWEVPRQITTTWKSMRSYLLEI